MFAKIELVQWSDGSFSVQKKEWFQPAMYLDISMLNTRHFAKIVWVSAGRTDFKSNCTVNSLPDAMTYFERVAGKAKVIAVEEKRRI